jgi:hypothetical protein
LAINKLYKSKISLYNNFIGVVIMFHKRNKIRGYIDYNVIIKNHPIIIYCTAIIIGFTAAFGIIAYLNKYFGIEFEKRGTYLYYKDFYLELNNNYVPKLYYENIISENNNLKMIIEKYRSKESDSLMTEIYKLKEELKTKTEELINYTTGMSVSLEGDIIQRNINTEKYRLLSEEIKSTQNRLNYLYEKL